MTSSQPQFLWSSASFLKKSTKTLNSHCFLFFEPVHYDVMFSYHSHMLLTCLTLAFSPDWPFFQSRRHDVRFIALSASSTMHFPYNLHLPRMAQRNAPSQDLLRRSHAARGKPIKAFWCFLSRPTTFRSLRKTFTFFFPWAGVRCFNHTENEYPIEGLVRVNQHVRSCHVYAG